MISVIHIVTADVVFLPHHSCCVTGIVREQEGEGVWTSSFDASIACWVGEEKEKERRRKREGKERKRRKKRSEKTTRKEKK